MKNCLISNLPEEFYLREGLLIEAYVLSWYDSFRQDQK